jgi:hypothetical protein
MTPREIANIFPEQQVADKPIPEPVEAIMRSDGKVEPAFPMVLSGLKASVQAANGTTAAQAVEEYKKWDPGYPIHQGHFR